MIKIILATSNPHKLEEINAINKNKNIVFYVIKEDFNPVENGKTFEENALIKAREAAKITGEYCLADDSGLCIDALEGAPGLFSARYAPTPAERINRVIKELNAVPYEYRTAHFNCSMVLVDKNGEILHKETGKIFGYIDDSPKGQNGFGYDPIFIVPEYEKTMAELSEEKKNEISHRANALNPMLKWIEENL
ncbi:RdgB/HAM1 family non-canonical purine NTP pyrophosphatase [bacterium]|nr:RdgB/HAM1 family non-canonical purine NTP pyrophosphatase [bacterium]